jgi:hypothetical protein
MNELGGWLRAFLGIVGVGGLGFALAYGINEWRHRGRTSLRVPRETAPRARFTAREADPNRHASRERVKGVPRNDRCETQR